MLRCIPVWLMFIILTWMLTACGGSGAGQEAALGGPGEPLSLEGSGSVTQTFDIQETSVREAELDENGVPDEEMQRYLRQVTVQIQGSKYLGSGVIWDVSKDLVVVATAAHVAEDNTPLTVRFGQEDPIDVQRSYISEVVDAAFLEIPLQEIEAREIAWQVARQDKEVCDRLETGQPLWIMGSVEEAADRTYDGIVTDPWIYLEDFENYMLLGRAYAIPGVSGGGVFTQDGILIGILCGGNEADQIAVLPWSVLDANSP